MFIPTRHRSSSCRITGRVLIVLLSMIALGSPLAAQDTEKKVKAALIYQFMRFTEWPSHAFRDGREPVVIATLHGNPLGRYLDVLERKKIRGRRIQVRHCTTLEQARGAHVLVLGSSSEEDVGKALAGLGSNPVLTVGACARFLELGGHVNFVKQRKKVKFEISTARLDGTALRISAKVLKLAVRVDRGRSPAAGAPGRHAVRRPGKPASRQRIP